jgi:hypothetical protein
MLCTHIVVIQQSIISSAHCCGCRGLRRRLACQTSQLILQVKYQQRAFKGQALHDMLLLLLAICLCIAPTYSTLSLMTDGNPCHAW